MEKLYRLFIYILFVFSGISGLIYEAIWTRYLSLFLGHAAYAQVTVLIIFLSGLAIGAFVSGKYLDRITKPFFIYGCLELIIGVMALYFHQIYLGVTDFSYHTLISNITNPFLVIIVKTLVSIFLIFPQTLLLGCTFPIICATLMKCKQKQHGEMVSILYFTNSIGAALGVLLVGFYLVPHFGLPGTVLIAGILNIIVAIAVYIIDASLGKRITIKEMLPQEQDSHHGYFSFLTTHFARNVLVLTTLVSAMTSFMYEIGWLRMLALVLGSATHAFEIMLSAFIFGLAMGAFAIHKVIDKIKNHLFMLCTVQILMGLFAALSLFLYRYAYDFAIFLNLSLKENDQGYVVYNLARFILCLIIMFPTTVFTGMTLPLVTKILLGHGHGKSSIGYVYGFNTIGSIIGVCLASSVLMGLLGVTKVVMVGSIIDILLGIMLGIACLNYLKINRKSFIAILILGIIGVLLGIFAAPINPCILASGVYRKLDSMDTNWDVAYYKDGQTASVAALKRESDGFITLKTNGKPDASLTQKWFQQDPQVLEPLNSDDATQTLLALIPLAHVQHAKEAAIIGQGAGMTGSFVLASPTLKSLTTIEIEPEMIEGSKAFLPVNSNVFKDPRSHFVLEDAKSFFAGSRKKFDLIISEPSNPWVSGVSNIFTTEFYKMISHSLAQNGVFGQWLHLYENDDFLVLTVLAAMSEHFQSFEIFYLGNFDTLILASHHKSLPKADWTVFSLPKVRKLLQHAPLISAEQIEACRLVNSPIMRQVIKDYRIKPNSDYYPYLDLGAEKARFLNTGALTFVNLRDYRFDIIAPFINQKTNFLTSMIQTINMNRVNSLYQASIVRKAWYDNQYISGSNATTTMLENLQAYENGLTLSTKNFPWENWITHFITLEEQVHKGTAGHADYKFYTLAYQYLQKFKAPSKIKDTVDFLFGLASWDFNLTSKASDKLYNYFMMYDHTYLPDMTLRDGAVISKIFMGEYEKAYLYLEKFSVNIPIDYRYYILQSLITMSSSG